MADIDPQVISVPASSRHGGEVLEMFLTGEQIRNRVSEIAEAVSDKFRGQCPILIGVLNGSFIFMADLVRQLDIDFVIDFIKLASYGSGKKSTGVINLIKDISTDITDRDVIIVEDIVDTGKTLEFLRNRLMEDAPNSITFIALFIKKITANLNFSIDYIGFNIPDRFFVGYGLDVDQKLRGLRSLYAFKEN